MIKTKAPRFAFLLAVIAISSGYEIFFLQAFSAKDFPNLFAVLMAVFFSSVMVFAMTLLRLATVYEKNKSYAKKRVHIKISENGIIASNNNDKDVMIGASFSNGPELIANPQLFYNAVIQAVKSALKTESKYVIFNSTLEVSLADDLKVSNGQIYIIRQVIKACRPLRIIERF